MRFAAFLSCALLALGFLSGSVQAGPEDSLLCDKYSGALPKVVDDLVNKVSLNPKVDFFRGGKYQKIDIPRLKGHLVAFLQDSLGCAPRKYRGRSMTAAHLGMKITAAQFATFMADLRLVLFENGMAPEDVRTVLNIVGSTRGDIVEAP